MIEFFAGLLLNVCISGYTSDIQVVEYRFSGYSVCLPCKVEVKDVINNSQKLMDHPAGLVFPSPCWLYLSILPVSNQLKCQINPTLLQQLVISRIAL